jgi:hypothetical protein
MKFFKDEKNESKPDREVKQPATKVDEQKNSLKVQENKDINAEKSNLSKSSLLPNRENTWRYYRERTGNNQIAFISILYKKSTLCF